MPDLHELDMRLSEIGRVIGHLEDAGDPIPDEILMESAEIEMMIEVAGSARNTPARLPMAA